MNTGQKTAAHSKKLAFIGVFAIAGAALVIATLAGTAKRAETIEPESLLSVTTGISVAEDTQASGSKYIQFNNSAPSLPPGSSGQFPAPGSNNALKPVSYWEGKFSTSGFNSYCDPRSSAAPEIELYHYQLSYCIDAFVNMYRATDDTAYLDQALRHTKKVIATAQVSRTLGANAYKDSYLGWTTRRGGNWTGKQVSLDELYLWRYVGTMLRVMNENNLHTAAKYEDDYTNILEFSEVHMFEKWHSRRGDTSPSDWIYRQNSNVVSHNALLAANLSAITTNTSRKSLYETVIKNINYNFPYYRPTGLKTHLSQRNKSVPTAAVWNQPWDNTIIQDHSHANAEMSYIAESITMGRTEWSKSEVPAFTSALLDVMVQPNGSCAFNVDGSGGTRSCWIYDGFAKLGRHDERMQKFLESRPDLHNHQVAAQGALNARFLGAAQ